MKTTVKLRKAALTVLCGALALCLLGCEQQASALAAETVTAEPEQAESQPQETTQPAEETIPEERFTLTFVGDCTLGASPGAYYAESGFVKVVGDDLDYPFRNVAAYFAEDDFTMANLEGVLADYGSPYPTKVHNFRGPAKYAKILSQGSIEMVAFANNHTMDYGIKGYEDTLSALQAEKVPYIEQGKTTVITANGLRIGIYAMPYSGDDEKALEAGIAQLQNQGAELIVVAAHWGFEEQYIPNVKQIRMGRAAIDAGAHIVYGTHPHVLQPIEVYGNGVIYYSLGNFSFGGHGNPSDLDTVILQQEVIRKAGGTVILGELHLIPACISSAERGNNYQPTPYPEGSEAYDRVLSKLAGPCE